MSYISSATPQEIACWQLAPANATLRVDLPKLQRGFVWSPAKVIDLWDSMLRGYPVGSLLLSEISGNENNGQTDYWLLDGQQRATSIAIGFHNPWSHAPEKPAAAPSTKEGWSLKVMPILWLNLDSEPQDQTKRFFPYLVNQSHPWGYNHQGSPIDWGPRRKALQEFAKDIGDTRYTSYPLCRVFPWEAEFPVPLAFILEIASGPAQSPVQAWTELRERCASLPGSWHSYYGKYISGGPADRWEGAYHAAQRFLQYSIHLNYLRSQDVADDPGDQTDNSLLFVRLNSGGTALGGEELIFSLFKSEFPEAKDAIEIAATGFMAPSHLFSLFARLVHAGDDPTKLAQPLTLKIFKTRLRDESQFKQRLSDFIENNLDGLMGKVRGFLMGTLDFQLPPALATRTIKRSPEAFLALLYWFHHGGETSGHDSHRATLGAFTALAWFGGGNTGARKINLAQWMGEVVARDELHASPSFWREAMRPLFNRIENPIPTFPPPKELLALVIAEIADNPNHVWDKFPEGQHHEFLHRHYHHIPESENKDQLPRAARIAENVRRLVGAISGFREFILYAQRHYLLREFTEFGQWEFNLENSNSPWDWDHIYPSAANKHDVYPRYRAWHGSIGNLRIEALSSNRSNQADPPIVKLQDQSDRHDSFISPEVWSLIQSTGDRIKDGSQAEIMLRIILTRMIEAYGKWYEQLRIGKLQG